MPKNNNFVITDQSKLELVNKIYNILTEQKETDRERGAHLSNKYVKTTIKLVKNIDTESLYQFNKINDQVLKLYPDLVNVLSRLIDLLKLHFSKIKYKDFHEIVEYPLLIKFNQYSKPNIADAKKQIVNAKNWRSNLTAINNNLTNMKNNINILNQPPNLNKSSFYTLNNQQKIYFTNQFNMPRKESNINKLESKDLSPENEKGSLNNGLNHNAINISPKLFVPLDTNIINLPLIITPGNYLSEDVACDEQEQNKNIPLSIERQIKAKKATKKLLELIVDFTHQRGVNKVIFAEMKKLFDQILDIGIKFGLLSTNDVEIIKSSPEYSKHIHETQILLKANLSKVNKKDKLIFLISKFSDKLKIKLLGDLLRENVSSKGIHQIHDLKEILSDNIKSTFINSIPEPHSTLTKINSYTKNSSNNLRIKSK